MNKAFYSCVLFLLVVSYTNIIQASGAGLYDRMREDRLYNNSGVSNSSPSGFYQGDNRRVDSNTFYYSSPYNTKSDQSDSYYYNTPQPRTGDGGVRTSNSYYYNWDTPNMR